MRIVIVDGQGGGIGKSLVEQVKKELPEAEIIAAGTNAIATANMMRAGAERGVTGENAIVYNCRYADAILGPIGIILKNGLMGEITDNISNAITDCEALKVLIPVWKCPVKIAGVQEQPMTKYVEDAVRMLKERD